MFGTRVRNSSSCDYLGLNLCIMCKFHCAFLCPGWWWTLSYLLHTRFINHERWTTRIMLTANPENCWKNPNDEFPGHFGNHEQLTQKLPPWCRWLRNTHVQILQNSWNTDKNSKWQKCTFCPVNLHQSRLIILWPAQINTRRGQTQLCRSRTKLGGADHVQNLISILSKW